CCTPPSAPDAALSATRSSSDPARVFGSAATISSSDAPIAAATADADPPPGVGSEEANAASRSRTDLSVSNAHLQTLMCSADLQVRSGQTLTCRADLQVRSGAGGPEGPHDARLCDTTRPFLMTIPIVSTPTRTRSIAGPSTRTASIC